MTRTQTYLILIENRLRKHNLRRSDLVRKTGLSAGAFTQWANGTNTISERSREKVDAAVKDLIDA